MRGRLKVRESAENYLKAIFFLKKRLGEVRSVDVANELGVSRPSVSNAIKKLRGEGLVDMDAYHKLILTEAGQKYAALVYERHVIIEAILSEILSIDSETAHSDACRIEHLVSAETFYKIKEFYLKNR